MKVNNEAIMQYGYSQEEFFNMTITEVRSTLDTPDSENGVNDSILSSEPYEEREVRHRKRDGSYISARIKSNLIEYGKKTAKLVIAINLNECDYRGEQIDSQKPYLSAIDEINQLLLKTDDVFKSLHDCFNTIGNIVEVDCIFQFKNNLEDKSTSHKLEWHKGSLDFENYDLDLQDIPFSNLTNVMQRLQNKDHFEGAVDSLNSPWIQEFLENRDIKYILLIPIWVREEFYGFIGFGNSHNTKEVCAADFQFLKTMASHLGHVLKRSEMYQDLIYSEAQFKSLIENGKDLIAILDSNGTFKYVSPSSNTILGSDPEVYVGKSFFDFIYEVDVPLMETYLSEILEKKSISIQPYRFPDAEGNWRWIRTELTNHLNTPLIEGIVANTVDVTAEVEKKMVDNLVTAMTLAIGKPGLLTKCLNKGLNHLLQISRICVSEIWLVSPDENRLNLISKSSCNETIEKFYHNSSSLDSLSPGEGLPGYTWTEKKVTVWTDISNDRKFLRYAAADASNIHTAIGLPLLYNEEYLGCIICFSHLREGELNDQINILAAVSKQIGAIVKQKITEVEYRNFFNISPDPHVIVGFDGYIKKCNKAFIELLEYDDDKIKNRSISQFIHSDDQRTFLYKLKKMVDAVDDSKSIETRFITKNGQIKILKWSGTSISESKVFVAAAQDVTEQRSVEENLKKAYERLRTAQKIAKIGYWVKEFNCDESVWSEETYSIYERSPETFTPTMESIAKAFHPDDRYLITSNPSENLEPGKLRSFEHRILTKSGKVKWVRQEIRMLTTNLGEPIQLEGTIQDITERKKYEDQLTISNEKFRLAMQASNEIIWEIDHGKQKVVRGKSRKQPFRYGKTETFSKENSWFSKMHAEDRDKTWESINRAFRNKRKKSWQGEYRILSSDGSEVFFVDRCYILRDKLGNPIRSVGSSLDVTDSRQQLQRIKKQNKNLREIAWLQSHVIRSPLSKIMGLTYLSRELNGGGKSNDEIMEMISEAANELDVVIREITNKTNTIQDEDSRNFIN
ncbi:PAS domain-containing protein [Gelidibacter gilvus]|uniref:histidine kinase n=1 Tax=Gelidibacter maritimus TaxID=2761487 RepID=A0A7W2R3X5_9FLAO|nr:PAS domain-containing protein [Gelidibacter maritimus]